MEEFLEILQENVNLETGICDETKKIEWNYSYLLSAGLLEILTEKSALFRHIQDSGVEIDLSKAFSYPTEGVDGDWKKLIDAYKEDVK